MLHLELPHINVLTKVDILTQNLAGDPDGEDCRHPPDYARPILAADHVAARLAALELEAYTDLEDTSLILGQLGRTGQLFGQRFLKMSAGLLEVVEDYGLVSFLPLDIQQKSMVAKVVEAADTATGFVFAAAQQDTPYAQGRVYDT